MVPTPSPRGDVEDLHPASRPAWYRCPCFDVASRLDAFVRVHDKHSRSIPGGSLILASDSLEDCQTLLGPQPDPAPCTAAPSGAASWRPESQNFGPGPNTHFSIPLCAENTASRHHSSRARDTLQLSCRDARQALCAERGTCQILLTGSARHRGARPPQLVSTASNDSNSRHMRLVFPSRFRASPQQTQSLYVSRRSPAPRRLAAKGCSYPAIVNGAAWKSPEPHRTCRRLRDSKISPLYNCLPPPPPPPPPPSLDAERSRRPSGLQARAAQGLVQTHRKPSTTTVHDGTLVRPRFSARGRSAVG